LVKKSDNWCFFIVWLKRLQRLSWVRRWTLARFGSSQSFRCNPNFPKRIRYNPI
jgi:hypothetical protein